MKIKEILEQDDGFALGSIDRSKIVKIGEIKDSADSCYQFITLEDDSGTQLKVKLLSKSHFMEDERDTAKFECGPPIKGKNQGLNVYNKDGKFRINVTSKATAIYSNLKDDESIPNEEDWKEDEDPDDTSDKSQLTETEYNLPDEFKEYDGKGPNDHLILESFEERLHIMKILNRENAKNGNIFPAEYMPVMATGILMAAEKAGKKILFPKSSKPKFDTINKPHNPTNEKKSEEASVDAGPLDLVQKLADFKKEVKKLNGSKYYNTPGLGKGADIVGDQLLDDIKRPKMISYFLKNTEETLSEKPKSLETWKGIKYFIRSLPAGYELYLLMEAVTNDFIADSIKFEGKNFQTITEKENELIEEKLAAKLEGRVKVAKDIPVAYFSLPEETRRLS